MAQTLLFTTGSCEHTMRCFTSERCSASSLNYKYLNPILKESFLSWTNYTKSFEIKWVFKFFTTSKCERRNQLFNGYKSKRILSFTINWICSSSAKSYGVIVQKSFRRKKNCLYVKLTTAEVKRTNSLQVKKKWFERTALRMSIKT